MSKTIALFSEIEEQQIIRAIVEAEKNTSGEIRVHLEAVLNKDPHERALEVFHKLKMDQTKYHNGVLFYLATENKKFVIYGDQGIHKRVPENFWEDVRNLVISYFKNKDYLKGITEGVSRIGEKLKEYFPIDSNDIDELSNQISKR